MPTKVLQSAPYNLGSGFVEALTTGAGSEAANVWAPGAVIQYAFNATVAAGFKDEFRLAMKQWEDVANITFQEVASGQNVTIGFADLDPGSAGEASLGPRANGVLSIDISYMTANKLQPGAYGFFTIVHELGHTLGLYHPGAYNGATATPADATFFEDNRAFSVMSYWTTSSAAEVGNVPYDGREFEIFGDPVAPFIWDVRTVQALYGANSSVRTGDNVYFHNALVDNPIYDVALVPLYSGVLWDNGGYDVVDLSGSYADQVVDLRTSTSAIFRWDGGRFSSILGNIGNLFIPNSVVIEEVRFGAGDDQGYARDGIDTLIDGGSGADVLYGGTGNDSLHGGLDNAEDMLNGEGGDDFYEVMGGDTVVDFSGKSFVRVIEGATGIVTLNFRIGAHDDSVVVEGAVDVDADLGSGADTYQGNRGVDLVEIRLGGEASGRGDSISLGGGRDVLTATGLGTLLGGIDIVDGGGGYDEFHGNFGVQLSLTNRTTGVTSLFANGVDLSSALVLRGFEKITFATMRTMVAAAFPTVSFAGHSIVTGEGSDDILLGWSSEFLSISTGSGNDTVGLVNDDFTYRVLNRSFDLGTGNDSLALGALGGATADGGSGVDVLDFAANILSPATGFRSDGSEFYADDFGDTGWLVVNESLGSFSAYSEIDFNTGDRAEVHGTFSNFESFTLPLNLEDLYFVGHETKARTVELVGRGFTGQIIQVSFGSGNDTLRIAELKGMASGDFEAAEFNLWAGNGRDTLDLSGLVTYYDQNFNLFDLNTGSFDRLLIDAADGKFERGFWNGYSEYDPAAAVHGRIYGFEIYYLPDFGLPAPRVRPEQSFDIRFIGNDFVNETVYGGDRDDIISGGGGHDRLSGGTGSDTLSGGSGRDVLDGGAGTDRMSGGASGDTFIFRSITDSEAQLRLADRILDFNAGSSATAVDVIDVSAIDSGRGTSFEFIGSARFTDVGQIRAVQFGTSVVLHFNSLEGAAPDMLIRLFNVTMANLDAGDFIL